MVEYEIWTALCPQHHNAFYMNKEAMWLRCEVIITWPPSSTGSEKSISRYWFQACFSVFLTELTTSRWQLKYTNWGIFLTQILFSVFIFDQSLQIKRNFPMSHGVVNSVAPFHTGALHF